MNQPEGYLLQVLQEQFGPHIGASPIALLSVIGRNTVGRVQVAAVGAALVREHATSGVSGVVPKFLDIQLESEGALRALAQHKKASFGAFPRLWRIDFICRLVSSLQNINFPAEIVSASPNSSLR
jgi:hypothetical protein